MKVQNNPKLTGKVLMVSLLTLMLTAGMLYGQVTIGGHVYTGAHETAAGFYPALTPPSAFTPPYYPAPPWVPVYDEPAGRTPPILDAQVMVQNQHHGGAFIAYGTMSGNKWTATVPTPLPGEIGEYVIMFSAPDHDMTSREVTVFDDGSVKYLNPAAGLLDGKVQWVEGSTLDIREGIDAYLNPFGMGFRGPIPEPSPPAGLLVFAFDDQYVNGEPDAIMEDPPLNGVKFTVKDEDGAILATGFTGTQDPIILSDGVTLTGDATYGLYYFTGLPPGEVIVESDASTVTAAANPHITFVKSDAEREWYLDYTEEGGPTWDPKLLPGDHGTEDGGFLIWHGYVEKLGQIDLTDVPDTDIRFDGFYDPTDSDGSRTAFFAEKTTLTGTLTDADGAFDILELDDALIEAFAPGVSANVKVPDGLVILFTSAEGNLVRPIATVEAGKGPSDPRGAPWTSQGYFEFTDVPVGRYKLMMFDVPLEYVWTQTQVTVASPAPPTLPLDFFSTWVPRFYGRTQGYVYDHSTGLPVAGATVHMRLKDGSIWKTTTSSGPGPIPGYEGPEPPSGYDGWYNFDNLPEVEVLGYVDVEPPPGFRGAMVTSTFYPDAFFDEANEPAWITWWESTHGPDDIPTLADWTHDLGGGAQLVTLGTPNVVTHNGMNRYVQWLTANYRADLFIEPIPAAEGDIKGFVYNDHFDIGTLAGDGLYDKEEERTLHGVLVELRDATTDALIAIDTTGAFSKTATLAQGWAQPYTYPGNEWGGVFVGPLPGYYEFRPGAMYNTAYDPSGAGITPLPLTLTPGTVYTVKILPGVDPALDGFAPSSIDYPLGVATVTLPAGDAKEVNFGVNTTPPAGPLNPDGIGGVPLAGEIEGGVFDDVNVDNRIGPPYDFTPPFPAPPIPDAETSLLAWEKAGVPGAPVGVYDHQGYLMGVGYMGNPACFKIPDPRDPTGVAFLENWICPPGEDPFQKPEMERRFAPGVHLYYGNDPTMPGYCPNYLPLPLPYEFGQGKFKFEADWSLIPNAVIDLNNPCNDCDPDPTVACDVWLIGDEPTIAEPTPPGGAMIFGQNQPAGKKGNKAIIHNAASIPLDPGIVYRINGEKFGDDQGYQTVTLAGRPLDVVEWTDTYIDVQIPNDAISGALTVATTTGISNALQIEINYNASRASYMARHSVFVDVLNIGPEDGSKGHPYNTIQEALDNLPGSSPRFVYVAPGSYHEQIHIRKNNVQLLGAGPQETTINATGGDLGPVIFIGKGGIHGSLNDIVISGFSITGGTVDDDIGCGIFGDYGNDNLDINNCVIFQNGGYYGGGIWLHYSNHNVRIWANTIANNGNYGGYGGGISVNDEPEYAPEHGQPEHTVDDYVPGPPPGTYEIFNNLIYHNYSPDYGSAITLYEIKDHLKVFGNMLIENKAEDHGGAVFFEDSGPVDLYSNVFLRNFCYDDGGAVSFEDVADTLSKINIYNNLFAENIADDHGENRARGGALAFDDVRNANVFNNTFVGNIIAGSFTPAGGAIDSERHGHEYNGVKPDGSVYMAPGYSDPKIFNNIIWGNYRLQYDQPNEGGEEEDLDYTWGQNYRWFPDQLHVDNPHLQPETVSFHNSNSFSFVRYNIIEGGYDYNNQPPTADAGLNQALKDLDNSGSEPVTLDGSGSSDTDGTIVSYLWSENGAPLAYEVNPTIDLPLGAHTLTLTVHDERGASHADLVNVTVIPNGPLSFNPTDDAFVRSNRADKNYGDTYEMRVRKSNSAKYHTYLKFNVNGLLGNVTSAKIQLKVIDASNQGGSIYPAGNGWDEASLNWNNAPGTTGSSLSSVGAVGLGEIVEFDVTSAISGNGTFSFCISNSSSDAAIYSSKEGTYAPKLMVEFEMAGGNQAPVADAGPNQILSDGDSSGDEDVTLNGSGSYDTDGSIVNYDWSESGSSIASGVNPTVSLSVGVHTITLTVTDDQGATGTDDVVVTVNPGGGGAGSLTFNPIDDSFVRSNKATKNYGGSDELRIRRSSSAKYYTYLKFNVAGVGGAVTNAKLRLKVINASNEGGEIYSVANGWDEGSVNWNNAPALGGSALSSNGPVALGDMVEFDVTSAIAGDGTYSFGIKNSTSDAAKYSSKEGVYAPELVVDFGAGGGNQSPVADAGPNQDVTDADNNGSEGVTLDGSGSFDNDGTIVSYDWSEGGSSIATGLNPPVNLALGVHTITLTVTDNEGATGTDDVVVTVNPGGGGVPGTYTFNPTDDSFVRSNKATKVYGASDELRVRITSKKIYAFLKFNVSGLGGAVVSAKVRLKAINGSNDGGGIYTVENGWDEGSLNWNNAPPIAGAPLSSVGAMATGDMVEFDVTGAIFGNGTYSFAIKNASSDAAKYSSKEGVYAPELVIETAAPGPILAIAENGAIGLNWNKIANGFGLSVLKGSNGNLQISGGNLNVDPLFVDPATLNWRLQSNSPAIDQADAGMGAHVDLERLPRSVVNGMIDMGAFEWRANSPMVMRIPTGVLGQFTIPTPGSSQLYP